MVESCKMTYFPPIILPVNISYFRLTFSLHVHKAHKKVTTYNKKTQHAAVALSQHPDLPVFHKYTDEVWNSLCARVSQLASSSSSSSIPRAAPQRAGTAGAPGPRRRGALPSLSPMPPAAASETRSTATKPSSDDPPLLRISSRGERDRKALSRRRAWQSGRKSCLTPGNNRVRAGSGCRRCCSSSSCRYGRCSTLFHSALIAVFHQLKARQLSAGGSSWLSRLSCSGRQQQSFTPAGESERQRNRDEEKHK